MSRGELAQRFCHKDAVRDGVYLVSVASVSLVVCVVAGRLWAFPIVCGRFLFVCMLLSSFCLAISVAVNVSDIIVPCSCDRRVM